MAKNKFCRNCKQYTQFFSKTLFNYFPENCGFCKIRGGIRGEKDNCGLFEESDKLDITLSEVDSAVEAVKYLMKIYKNKT